MIWNNQHGLLRRLIMEKKLLLLGLLLSHSMHGYQLNEMLKNNIGIPITLKKSNAYKILGRIEYHSGNFTEAEKYLNDALVMKKEVNDPLSLPRIYLYKGLILIKKGMFDEGIENINQGLEISVSNEQKKIQLEINTELMIL